MTDVWIGIDGKSLIVSFGERTAVLDLKTDEEKELVEKLLGDVNLWHNFLSSLSVALTQQLGKDNV